jgi:hypothetical protein
LPVRWGNRGHFFPGVVRGGRDWGIIKRERIIVGSLRILLLSALSLLSQLTAALDADPLKIGNHIQRMHVTMASLANNPDSLRFALRRRFLCLCGTE